ncbi:undecaprenyl-diphosphate phosphatase [Methylobacillus glycogenes]|uniref:undecaprenyl-diphosphate phosphatase n=1 Tax=Methylobacillus glycogenes TaxID=406 RepID=UPI00046FFDF4|nr:undecaprenyl-diphosphate phosphatase [Methylobacillus glycogenes]MBL8505902.1 undecaprenyl-diphosphate phosphatase [Methylobacillus glycogenes]
MDLLLLFKAFILGVIEGATEFLPISSTGHLIIIGDLLDFNDEKGKVFEIVIQLGAILAVCWEYRSRLTNVATTLNTNVSQRFILNLFIAFLPAAVAGLTLHSFIKEHLFSSITVACALIVGGFVILLVENLYAHDKAPVAKAANLNEISPLQALKVGCAQALAIMPGVSRSGATILGGMIFGLNRKTATEFSFFLAIPVMLAATTLDVYKNRELFVADDLAMFAIGFITAFLSALIAIKTLIRYVANHDFKGFAYYRIVLGIIVLAYYW